MSDLRTDIDRLLRLADEVCAESASADDLAALDALLLSDRASRRCYLDYCQMHSALGLELRAQDAVQTLCRQIDSATDETAPRPICVADPSSPAAPFSQISYTAFHGIAGYLSSGWPVAYLIATVIFGVGALIGAFTYVSHPVQIAGQSASLPSPLSPLPSMVGQITGMVDCKWGNSSKGPASGHVLLGQKFILTSGLMEIAYNTGAKVLLQGPLTYEVESNNGGYLSRGKLTARLETKAEGGGRRAERVASGRWPVASESEIRNQKSEISNPQSPTPNPFFVRTPTAIVTDLGTEFGVEVSKEGLSQIHVFQGTVETQCVGPNGQKGRREIVTAGSAIMVGGREKEIQSVAFAPRRFARKLLPANANFAEAAYIHAVLDDKPLGYWPLDEPEGSRKYADRSGHGFHGYAVGEIAVEKAACFQSGSRAARFDHDSCIDIGRRDEFASFDDFTVEAWVSVGDIASYGRIISAVNVNPSEATGWVLTVIRLDSTGDAPSPAVLRLSTYVGGFYDFRLPSHEISDNRWLHVALVFDRSHTASLYINGQYRESVRGGEPSKGQWAWVGIGSDPIDPGEYFRGGLGHVAVYPYALGASQIKKHYDQRSVAEGD